MKPFCLEHSLYLVISTIIIIPFIICAKKFAKEEKTQNTIIKVLGILLLLSILANRITRMFITGKFTWHYFFPTTLCGATNFLLAFAVLFGKKDNGIYHFLWLLAFAGGILATIYPNYLDDHNSFFHPETITSLLHHTFSFVTVIILLMFKHINVTYKKWYYSLIGICAYILYGALMMGIFQYPDAFNMCVPILNNTPLTIWVMGPIYIVVYTIILLIVELFRRKNKKFYN